MKATVKNDQKFSTGELITGIEAVSIVEGISNVKPTLEDNIKSWAYLIRTKLVWSLQGWFGRGAQRLIDGGVISHQGVINWDNVNVPDESVKGGEWFGEETDDEPHSTGLFAPFKLKG